MTKLKQVIQGDLEKYVFACYCGEDSYLDVTKDPDDGELYITITMHPTKLRERLQTAWKALRGLEFSASNSIIVVKDDIDSLIEALKPNNSEAIWGEKPNGKVEQL